MTSDLLLAIHLDDILRGGYLNDRPEGEVYQPLPEYPSILAVNGLMMHEHGLHARPSEKLVDCAKRLGIGQYYGVAVANGITVSLLSIIGLLLLAARKGTIVSVVTQDVAPEGMMQLYRTLTTPIP